MTRALLVLVLVALAPRAEAQDRAFRASLVAAVAAHGADLATTEHLLGQSYRSELQGRGGLYHETNLYLGHVSANPLAFGIVKMGTAAGGLWLIAKLHDAGHRRLAIALNLAQTVALTAAATHNYRIGRQ